MTQRKQRSPDPDDPITEEEIEAAELLRVALERGSAGPDSDLVEALRAARDPARIAAPLHDAIVARALSGASVHAARRGKIVYAAFGAVTALVAAAAALALVVRWENAPASVASLTPAREPLAVSRSTSELFSERFPVAGGTSDRIDRIASARQQDLRENRFAAWGVR